MKILKFKAGDPCWIYGAGNPYKNELMEGKVVAELSLPGYNFVQYIVAVATPIEDVFHVRAGEAMSDTAKGPIGLYRR